MAFSPAPAIPALSKIWQALEANSKNLEQAIKNSSNYKVAIFELKHIQWTLGLPDPVMMLLIDTVETYYCGDRPCSACGDPTIRDLHIVKIMFPLGLTLCIPSLPAEDQPSVFLCVKLAVHLATGATSLEQNLEVCAYTPSGIEFSYFESDDPTVEMMERYIENDLQQALIKWNAIHCPGSSLASTFWENCRLVATLPKVSLPRITIGEIREHFNAAVASSSLHS